MTDRCGGQRDETRLPACTNLAEIIEFQKTRRNTEKVLQKGAPKIIVTFWRTVILFPRGLVIFNLVESGQIVDKHARLSAAVRVNRTRPQSHSLNTINFNAATTSFTSFSVHFFATIIRQKKTHNVS
jgi:hypothetical protein